MQDPREMQAPSYKTGVERSQLCAQQFQLPLKSAIIGDVIAQSAQSIKFCSVCSNNAFFLLDYTYDWIIYTLMLMSTEN
jgi:hypothetical protein